MASRESSSSTSAGTPKSAPIEINSEQRWLLLQLSTMPGADVWDRPDARVCRELEPLGLVRIVRAKNAPADGAARQPYFGAKITAAGRRALVAYAAGGSGTTSVAAQVPQPIREDQ